MKIERAGRWPVFKYTLRLTGGDYAVVMLDDDHGDILINPGDDIAFLHWWGKTGRGEKSLRNFLVRTSESYIGDKLSYGLSRWTHSQAYHMLRMSIEEKLGHVDTWPEDVQEEYERLRDYNTSPDAFYLTLYSSEALMGLFPDLSEIASGEGYFNPKVEHFMNTKWPHFINYWKQELEMEIK